MHLRQPIDAFQDWVIGNRATHPLFVYFFDPISDAIDSGIRKLEDFLLWLPWPVLVTATFLLAYRAGGFRVALLCATGLLFMGMVDLWEESMQTLALMGVAVIIALGVGIPLGILAARSNKLDALLSGQPACIATANIGCLNFMRETSPVPIMHWIELIHRDLNPR